MAARSHATEPPTELVTGAEAELVEGFLSYLDHRRHEAQRRLDELARRRAAMSVGERITARESLRRQAATLRHDMWRYTVARSLTRGLLHPSSEHPRTSTYRDGDD